MEVLDGVHMPPRARWARAYLIVGETLTLVDSGLPWDGGGVLAYIESLGRRPRELRRILMTHGHPDHAGSAARLSRATGAEIIAHRADTVAMGDGRRALAYKGSLGMIRAPIPFQRPAVARRLVEDGDLLPIHGGIRVVHTPGHTPGSLCFLLERSGAMFTGDTIFSDGEHLSRSVPFPGHDADAYARSLKRLAEMRFETALGGHGYPLMRGASAALRGLLAARPEAPTWGMFFKSVPRRFSKSLPMTGEWAD